MNRTFEQTKRDLLGGKDYPSSVTTPEQQQEFDKEFKHMTLVAWPELFKLMPCPSYGDPNFNRYMELADKMFKFTEKCLNDQ